jgi:hypothetical protein
MSAEQIEQPVIDKSTWGEGPWQYEPDRVDFVHAGYACLLVRHWRMGQWCGYVGVDDNHPYYGKPYQDVDDKLEVHGGLTYANRCNGYICHVPAAGMPADVWWFGFDAAHAGDLTPGLAARERALGMPELDDPEGGFFRDVYRTIDYVRAQTELLAKQLRALAERKPEQPALFEHAPEPD